MSVSTIITIRPESLGASVGFPGLTDGTFIARTSDNDATTFSEQSNATAELTINYQNPDIPIGSQILSVRAGITGRPLNRGDAVEVIFKLNLSPDNLQTETLSFDDNDFETKFLTQLDVHPTEGTPFTVDNVNNLSQSILPDTVGFVIAELFIDVSYVRLLEGISSIAIDRGLVRLTENSGRIIL